MDGLPETFALVTPEGVVTYNLHSTRDDNGNHLTSYPVHGRLHGNDAPLSTPLERTVVEHYIRQYGAGRRLEVSF
jgi:hypothetical protein